jgi:Tfp pilus assembly protein PilX
MPTQTFRAFPAARIRGSAFVTVIMFTTVMFLLAGSIIRWSLTERRLNGRNASWLEARNGAEAVAEYGFAQIVTQFNSYATPPSFNPSGSTPLTLPASSFFAGGNLTATTYAPSTNPYGLELVGGTLSTVPTSGALYFVDPLNPDNVRDTLAGQWVFRRDVQVLARASVVPSIGAAITAYVTE